jgi:hypothetical protein
LEVIIHKVCTKYSIASSAAKYIVFAEIAEKCYLAELQGASGSYVNFTVSAYLSSIPSL